MAAVTLDREQRDAFRDGVDDLLYRLRVDDLLAFEDDPWGVIRQLSACALALEQLDEGDPRRDSYQLTVTPELCDIADRISSYSRMVLDDCRVDLRGRPGPWSHDDQRARAVEARASIDCYLEQFAVAEKVRMVA